MTEIAIRPKLKHRPSAFTQAEIGWTPWLAPLVEEELTDRHWAGLVEPTRAKSAYFMLLVRDLEILEAGTKTDKGHLLQYGGRSAARR